VTSAIDRIDVPGMPLFRQGKIRETYDLGDRLLMVASDRISAYDSILPNAIPLKGIVLTQLSRFWFERTRDIVPNHLITTSLDDVPSLDASIRARLEGRSMIVRKAQRIDVECVARGYLSGSGWAEYQRDRHVCGILLPDGLVESEKLPEPVFTPAMKADSGHDLNITFDRVVDLVGSDLAAQLRETTLRLYSAAERYAATRGILIADTKFEFGIVDGTLTLIDEVLTPDSSRFWDAEHYQPGGPQASFDKQFVRDWLNAAGWDREPPPPSLPLDVVEATSRKYVEAYERITGRSLFPLS
jgi:phosphoribosylaminoimidazole-succinocarboxamide synthase